MADYPGLFIRCGLRGGLWVGGVGGLPRVGDEMRREEMRLGRRVEAGVGVELEPELISILDAVYNEHVHIKLMR